MRYAKVFSIAAIIGLAVLVTGRAQLHEGSPRDGERLRAATFMPSATALASTPTEAPVVTAEATVEGRVVVTEAPTPAPSIPEWVTAIFVQMANEEYRRIAEQTARDLEEWSAPVATATIRSAATIAPAVTQVAAAPTVVTIEPKSNNIDAALAASNWPAELWGAVKRIIQCESGGITDIWNGPHYGLMQANVNYWGNPGDNAVAQLNQGYHIYLTQGWGAWSCY